MIAVTAAKESWKLGPASDSGHASSTISAPAATSRKVSASRPIAIAATTRSEATHDRTVGTPAPASSVYPTAAAAPAIAAITGRRNRSASHGLSASSRNTSHIVMPTTAVTCRPLMDSKCASPARRIASASPSVIAPVSPVTSAVAIPPALPDNCPSIWRVSRTRIPSDVPPAAAITRTGAKPRPVAPICANQAVCAKS